MRLIVCASVLAALVAATTAAPSSATKSRSCGNPGYSYAGVQSNRRAHGVRATLSAIAPSYVASGHVAAWVGVGGPGGGPNGTTEWLQIGLNTLSDGSSHLYYEVTLPGASPTYHELDSDVRPGERKRVVVLEMARRPSHWRVWVNGEPVSPAIYLSGSSGRWEPIATAETWDGGRRVCNGFAYRFDHVRVAHGRGGSWYRLVTGNRWEDPGYRVQRRSRTAFRALAMAAPVWRSGFWTRRSTPPAVSAKPTAAPAPPPAAPAPAAPTAEATAPASADAAAPDGVAPVG
jgi:hypothetical protein